jgi:hypothetical protein
MVAAPDTIIGPPASSTTDGVPDAPGAPGLVSGIYWPVLMVVHSRSPAGAGPVGPSGA